MKAFCFKIPLSKNPSQTEQPQRTTAEPNILKQFGKGQTKSISNKKRQRF